MTVFFMTLLATYALFLGGPRMPRGVDQNILTRRAEEDVVCDDVHLAKDQCAFVKAHCTEDEPGLLSYLTFYYCSLPRIRPIAFAVLTFWLGLLFSTIGIAASDFFSVNLSTIASVLGLPESLAGVTFLAFGNGSPDVFSTFAAMNSNSGSMAIGELIGAAGFITAVVAGSMALVREFKVSRKTFVRDIVFFIVSVSFTMLFLLDGEMHLWECGSMIGFYVFYVCFVVMWHWFSSRRRRMRAKQAASRSHYSVVSSHLGDEIEPYRDDAHEETDGRVGQRGGSESVPDITVLESGTRNGVDDSSQDEDDEDQKRHVASEMTSSMRVNRPRGRRTTSTITPIRPSLVGALEFRSVMSSLAKSRNMRMAPLTRGHSEYITTGLTRTNSDIGHSEPYRDNPSLVLQAAPQTAKRDRALSSGDAPRHLHNETMENAPLLEVDQPPDESNQETREGRTPSPAPHKNDSLVTVAQRTIAVQGTTRRRTSSVTSSTKDGRLAPPDIHSRPVSLSPEPFPEQRQSTTPALSLRIPSPNLQPSQLSSPSLSPFPVLLESPNMMGQPSPQRSHGHLPGAHVETYDHIPGLDPPQSPQLKKWWPYTVLPPPHVLWRTLMPTLQGWKDKSIWDKGFSVFSLPSVFLLVITLPVVETETIEEDEKVTHEQQHNFASSSLGVNAPAIAIEAGDSVEHETEWQEYRRRARSVRSRSSSHSRLRLSGANTPTTGPREQFPDYLTAGACPYGAQPLSEHGIGSEPTTEDSEPPSWNRWLIALQIFVGPIFTTFIIWAKYMDQPVKVLAEMVLYCLLGSLIVLAVLLLSTTPDQKPKYHFLFCFLGFIISIAWISTIAEEVVGVLKAVGVILGMSEAILGLTVFAVGNSVGDLVADITVARLGFPVMALYVRLSSEMDSMIFLLTRLQICMLRRSDAEHSAWNRPGWNLHDYKGSQTPTQKAPRPTAGVQVIPYRSDRDPLHLRNHGACDPDNTSHTGSIQQMDDDQEDWFSIDIDMDCGDHCQCHC